MTAVYAALPAWAQMMARFTFGDIVGWCIAFLLIGAVLGALTWDVIRTRTGRKGDRHG